MRQDFLGKGWGSYFCVADPESIRDRRKERQPVLQHGFERKEMNVEPFAAPSAEIAGGGGNKKRKETKKNYFLYGSWSSLLALEF